MSQRMIAYLIDGQTIYYAQEAVREHSPLSAIVKLIQGIYDHSPDQARRILRNRIYSNVPPSEMCWGMIKVAARKFEAPVEIELAKLSADPNSIEMQYPNLAPATSLPFSENANFSHADFLFAAQTLASQVTRTGALYECDRAIAAILVSPDGKILSAGVNSNAKNKTLHAEVNTLQNFYSQFKAAVPKGARLYSTMKPCRMCAAMLWQMSEDFRTIKVYYAEFDSGPNARSTILNAGSLERRRACIARSDILLEIEEQVLI